MHDARHDDRGEEFRCYWHDLEAGPVRVTSHVDGIGAPRSVPKERHRHEHGRDRGVVWAEECSRAPRRTIEIRPKARSRLSGSITTVAAVAGVVYVSHESCFSFQWTAAGFVSAARRNSLRRRSLTLRRLRRAALDARCRRLLLLPLLPPQAPLQLRRLVAEVLHHLVQFLLCLAKPHHAPVVLLPPLAGLPFSALHCEAAVVPLCARERRQMLRAKLQPAAATAPPRLKDFWHLVEPTDSTIAHRAQELRTKSRSRAKRRPILEGAAVAVDGQPRPGARDVHPRRGSVMAGGVARVAVGAIRQEALAVKREDPNGGHFVGSQPTTSHLRVESRHVAFSCLGQTWPQTHPLAEPATAASRR